MAIIINSWADFISHGQSWSDGSGNVEINTNIVVTTTVLNSAPPNLFKNFNAIMDFKNNIFQLDLLAGQSINRALITDLSGGTIKDLIFRIVGSNDLTFTNTNHTGILVRNSDVIFDSNNKGSYGNLENIIFNIVSNPLIPNNNNISIFLPPYFGNRRDEDMLFKDIIIEGSIRCNTSHASILGQTMLQYYEGTITMENIIYNINLSETTGHKLSLLGNDFGKGSTGALFYFLNCEANQNQITNTDRGGFLEEYAFRDASNINVYINNCSSSTNILPDSSYSGSFVGPRCFHNATNSVMHSYGCKTFNTNLIEGIGGGFFGSHFFDNTNNCTLNLTNFKADALIRVNDSGGVFGKYFFNNSQNSKANISLIDLSSNMTEIQGTGSGGIIGSYALNNSTNSQVYIKEILNYAKINGEGAGGIIGSHLNNDSSNCTVYLEDCANSIISLVKEIIGDGAGGIIGSYSNNNSNSIIKLNECVNNFHITGPESGGFIGKYAGNNQGSNGYIEVNNCINHKNINDKCGGIIGSNLGYNANSYVFDNYIYIYGGETSSSQYQFKIQRFDGTTIEELEEPFLPYRITRHSSVFYNGKVYTICGKGTNGNTNLVQIMYYDMSDSVFKTIDTMLPAPFSGQLEYIEACAFYNKIYIIGGLENTTIQKTVWAYDGNTIEAKTDLSERRINHTVHAYNDTLYVIGGDNTITDDKVYNNSVITTNIVEKYNPTTNTWTTITLPVDDVLKAGISRHSSVIFKNNIYIFGGYNSSKVKNTSVIVFNIDTEESSIIDISYSSFMGTSYNSSASTLNNRIYIFGGTNFYGDNIYSNSIFEFNPFNEEMYNLNQTLNIPVANHSTVVGTAPFSIINCKNMGDLGGIESGGCIGYDAGSHMKYESKIKVDNFINDTSIFNNESCGGVLAPGAGKLCEGEIYIYNCENKKSIDAINSGGIVSGGVANDLSTNCILYIEGCTNDGDIEGDFSGGIAGNGLGAQNNKGTIYVNYCINNGDINGDNCAGIVGQSCNYNVNATTNIMNCVNNGIINSATSSGIIGNNAGENMSGTITISNCLNTGELKGTNLISGFFDGTTMRYYEPSNYNASAGIVGKYLGKDMMLTGTININNCDNNGLFDASYTSGIASFGVGYGSSGTINFNNCINNSTITNSNGTGITYGVLGVNNTGTINFNGCKNYGDISGVLNMPTSGLIYVVGHYDGTNNSSGTINLNGCINNNSIIIDNVTGSIVEVAGLVSSIEIPTNATNQLIVNISNCSNEFNSITITNANINLTTSDLVLQVVDNNSTTNTIEHIININNCDVSNSIINKSVSSFSSILNSIEGYDNTNNNTKYQLNIYNNVVNTIIEETTECEISSFIQHIGDYIPRLLTNKKINISNNNIKYNRIINSLSESYTSGILTISNLDDSELNIYNNTITIEQIENSQNISGLLTGNIMKLKDTKLNINRNNIILNNVSDDSINIAGVLCSLLTTTDPLFIIPTIEGTFFECDNIDVSVHSNIISSNTPASLINSETKKNGALFSSIVGGINESMSEYLAPTGTLIIDDNNLSNNFFSYQLPHISSHYFPNEFRPYVYILNDYPNSNYWFGNGITIDMEDPDYNITVGSKTNDTILRAIFKRALTGIREQKNFGIYPFYHLKVKGKNM